MSIRDQLESLNSQIETLQYRKQPILRAWEGEKIRQGDPDLPKPADLKQMNKQLYYLYTERDAYLERNPSLKKEFGSSKKSSGPSPLGERGGSDIERKARKKANHEANLARRREEDRERSRLAGSGTTRR